MANICLFGLFGEMEQCKHQLTYQFRTKVQKLRYLFGITLALNGIKGVNHRM